jgi:hypothetical protein
VNLVERLLERFGRLPGPAELRLVARDEPGLLAPTSQMRAARELEPPTADEGFASVERVEFERAPRTGRPGVLVAAPAVGRQGWEAALEGVHPETPCLVFDWDPGGDAGRLDHAAASLATLLPGPIVSALCPHPAGPPVCWCRPPLPGLPLAFAREQRVDPAASTVVGSAVAHRTLANALGAACVVL